MKTTIADIYRRKAERRHIMAKLPFEEKIKIVEELKEFAKATEPFRKEHQRTIACRKKAGHAG